MIPETLEATIMSMLDLIQKHAWIPLAVIVIGLIVRLLKSDTRIPFTIPPEYRRFAVVVLGMTSAALERVVAGTPWKDAALGGFVAIFGAYLGHYFVVDKLRDGKELAIPGLIIPGASPAPGAPVTIPPSAMKPPRPPTIPLAMLIVLAFPLLSGCAALFHALDLAADKAKCVVDYQELPNAEIFRKCAIQPDDIEKYIAILTSARQASARAAAAAAERAASDRSDAGCQ